MNNSERLMGTETEFGVFIRRSEASRFRSLDMQQRLSQYIVRKARAGSPMPKFYNFHENGALTYLDHDHPEYSSPVTLDAASATIQDMYGEEAFKKPFLDAVEQLSEMENYGLGINAELSKKNCAQHCDPVSGNLASWGVHENYQVLREHAQFYSESDFVRGLAAHNITRLIFTGAGGYIEGEYWVSPRAYTIEDFMNSDTTKNRPIINSRDEPLASDPDLYRRVHNINGEGNMSPWQIHMRLGTTALVIKALERGVYLSDLCPENRKEAVNAMRSIGSDLTLNHTVGLPGERRMDAIAIQGEILKRVRRFAETDDELLIVDEWEQALTELDHFRYTKAITDFLISMDWLAKQWIIDKKTGVMGNSTESLDMNYHMIINSKGGHGIGHKLRESGIYRLMPEVDLSIENGPSLPSSARARMLGRAARSPLLSTSHDLFVNWTHYNLNLKEDDLRKFPDHPTPEEEASFNHYIDELEQAHRAAA